MKRIKIFKSDNEASLQNEVNQFITSHGRKPESFQLTVTEKNGFYGTLIYVGPSEEEVNQETGENADPLQFDFRTIPRSSSRHRY